MSPCAPWHQGWGSPSSSVWGSVGLGSSSGAQRVVVEVSPPVVLGEQGGCFSPTQGLLRGRCFTLGSGGKQGLGGR